MSKRKALKDLYYGCLDVESVFFDFSEGYAESWEFIEAVQCSTCGKTIVLHSPGEEKHCDIDEDTKCEDYVSSEGPMMNYYYPLPDGVDDDEMAKLVDLPLCVVEFIDSGESALALTGGGMNLSWEICEAFMLLGFLPPIAFSDLPSLAGKKLTARNKWILGGCAKSCRVVMRNARNTLESIKRLRKNMGK